MAAIRVGQGIDIHALKPGRKLILGGVEIAHPFGLEGHSDADVLIHALMDALLGALGKGDIGTRFPNTDEKWRGANSIDLLKNVWGEIHSEGWQIGNIDLTVLVEAPKIAPLIPKMKENICAALSISAELLGLKATTAEKLGFIGRKEGILASCAVLLTKN